MGRQWKQHRAFALGSWSRFEWLNDLGAKLRKSFWARAAALAVPIILPIAISRTPERITDAQLAGIVVIVAMAVLLNIWIDRGAEKDNSALAERVRTKTEEIRGLEKAIRELEKSVAAAEAGYAEKDGAYLGLRKAVIDYSAHALYTLYGQILSADERVTLFSSAEDDMLLAGRYSSHADYGEASDRNWNRRFSTKHGLIGEAYRTGKVMDVPDGPDAAVDWITYKNWQRDEASLIVSKEELRMKSRHYVVVPIKELAGFKTEIVVALESTQERCYSFEGLASDLRAESSASAAFLRRLARLSASMTRELEE